MKIKKIFKNKILSNIYVKKIFLGIVYIISTSNNTIITITDNLKNTISWSTSSKVGFKGAKKCSPYAAQMASESASKIAYRKGLRSVNVVVKGYGPGRDLAIKGIFNSGISILTIKDATPISHNGCRARKIRRI